MRRLVLPEAKESYDWRNERETRRLIEGALQQDAIPAEETPTDSTPFNETLTFHSEGGWAFRFDNMPTAETYWALFKRPWYDSTGYTHARVCLDVVVPSEPGAYVQLQFTQYPEDDTSWQNAAFTGFIECSMGTAGPRRGPWVQLKNLAISDVAWRVVTIGGDGTTSPVLGYVKAEFGKRPVVALDRWYFRDPFAVFTALSDLGENDEYMLNSLYFNFWSHPAGGWRCKPLVTSWTTPTPTDIAAAPRSLLRAKGSDPGMTLLDIESPVINCDISGHMGRFVSPPLGAQRLNGGRVNIAYNGQCGNGSATGYIGFVLWVVRPGVGPVARFMTTYGAVDSTWFRFINKDRIVPLDIEDVDLLDNDRIVIDLITTAATTGLVLLPIHHFFHYNGGDDNFVNGADGNPLTGAASYIELPPLLTLAETA